MTQLRMGLATVGMVLALVGVLRSDRWLVWGAIGAIGAAWVIRIIGQRRSAPTNRG